MDYDLGIALPYGVGGVAWSDVNSSDQNLTRNGVMNATYRPGGSGQEKLLPDITVTLYEYDEENDVWNEAKDMLGREMTTTTSDVNDETYGTFRFDCVRPGTYYAIAEDKSGIYTIPTNFVDPYPGVLTRDDDNDLYAAPAGNVTGAFTLATPQYLPGSPLSPAMGTLTESIGLGYYLSEKGKLSGVVWEDENRDGYRDDGDDGEPRQEGITVILERYTKDEDTG